MINMLRNIRFPVTGEFDLQREIGKKLGIPGSEVELVSVLRKAVDTRRKDQPIYDYTVSLRNRIEHPDLSVVPETEIPKSLPVETNDKHPFIIGMGPAGLFCALAMVRNGFQPILFDQGERLEQRSRRVEEFWKHGILDADSNVQSGEGGAGAFSDGKLTSRNRDWHIDQVYSELIRFGADPSISYEALPHLGTDGIRKVVGMIRDHLISRGCQFRYRSKLTGIKIEGGHLKSVRINEEVYEPAILILALGNSARETFTMLNGSGLTLERKPFAVGVRIEHPQAIINRSVYGSEKWVRLLGPATYRLTYNGTYTFCMCPGGYVIGASSELGGCVTNGMSFASRNGKYCNSALVATVDANDFGTGLFAGMEFQQQIERASYRKGYLTPAQQVSDFRSDTASDPNLITSYRPGIYSRNLSTLFPKRLISGLKSALLKFDATIRDFSRGAVLIAPETRTSSPLRILRHQERRCCISCEEIFPIGEGSGYAGGIISSAADGFSLGLRLRIKEK